MPIPPDLESAGGRMFRAQDALDAYVASGKHDIASYTQLIDGRHNALNEFLDALSKLDPPGSY